MTIREILSIFTTTAVSILVFSIPWLPFEVARTEAGAREIENLLGAIEGGGYS